MLCSRCRGRGWCGRPCVILERLKFLKNRYEKIGKDFFGATPPSIFVGRYGYPNVNTGILTPPEIRNSSIMDSPDKWYEEKLGIEEIMRLRYQLIFSQFKTNVKNPKGRLVDVQREVVQSIRPVDMEIELRNKPIMKFIFDISSVPILKPAEVRRVKIAENPKIPKAIDKVVSDTDLKSTDAVVRLYESKININSISKIFSAGLLGIKIERKMVPTRWSITATDDIVSSKLIEKIKNNKEISEYLLFSNEYLGNHYEILLIPRHWSYELIEAKLPGSVWNPNGKDTIIYHDYESFWKRKYYAEDTAGGYYAARLGVCEYLNKIRRQASVLVIREVKDEYYAPLGVWVPRETVRGAFKNTPMRFSCLDDSLKEIKKRIKINFGKIQSISKLLKEIRFQKVIRSFLNPK